MSNRKRVTLTFEIDDRDGYNDEAFMRYDFLQELSCCVNDPYADTFIMKVEDADAPHEMTAREYIIIEERCKSWCLSNLRNGGCESCCYHKFCWVDALEPEEYLRFYTLWAKEHPEERNE